MADTNETTLHPAAHALTIFRGLKNGEGRAYTATTFPADPWSGCERFVRMCRHVGWIKEGGNVNAYGALDVLNSNGDIVQDFSIPTSEAFQGIKRKLNLAVERA